MKQIIIVCIRHIDPKEYSDGSIVNYRVCILREGDVLNTGLVFEHEKDAETSADGMYMGLVAVGIAYNLEYVVNRAYTDARSKDPDSPV